MHKLTKIVILTIILILPIQLFAAQGDIYVGDVSLSEMKWGNEHFNIELVNNSDLLKYIVVQSDLKFEGTYLNPEFQKKSTFVLYPSDSVTIKPELFIPGNYGDVTINLNLYDVIDTLDELMPWQQFYTQPFKLKFKPTDAVFPYLQEKIVLPQRVDVHPYFNYEFSRLLMDFLKEGKSAEDIAEMTQSSIEYVQSEIDKMVSRKLVSIAPSGYKMNFAVISLAEAEDARKIAEKYADELAVRLAENMTGYQGVLDSLIAEKIIPNDSNDFISGASLLFKKTPMVSTMVLWYELGRKFITRSAPLLIYDGTDICDASNVQYMYAVNGGDYFVGKHFFGLFLGPETYSLMFTHDDLNIKCEDEYMETLHASHTGVWKYDHPNYPEYFIVDTNKVRPFIDVMAKGTDQILSSAYDEMKANALAHKQEHVFIGQRFWFWNLMATLTLDKLYEQSVLNKRGEGFFRFDKLKG